MPSATQTNQPTPESATSASEKRVTEPKSKKSKPKGEDSVFLAMVEAVVFSTDRPVSAGKLAEGLEEFQSHPAASESKEADENSEQDPASSSSVDQKRIAAAVAALNEQYEQSGRSFRIEQVAGGYRVMTLAEYADVIGAFQKQRDSSKLSKPALETLAIVAYRQPITRADLEAIRGVSCGEVLRSLLEKRLIAITGRAEVLGRPMLYGTTRAFLDAFGLSSIKDLPQTGDQAGELSQSL